MDDDFDYEATDQPYEREFNWADEDADEEGDEDSADSDSYIEGGDEDDDDPEIDHQTTVVEPDLDHALEPVFNQKVDQSGMIHVVVIDKARRTGSDIVSLYEMTECVSIRATQIAKNGYKNDKLDFKNISDPIIIAKLEFMSRQCPLLLRRKMYEKVSKKGTIKHYIEFWDPKEMDFAKIYEF